ncbi:MAG TPA: ATP-binding cassette domain-containing protein [Blastocatellia bacterium]|nr:ATP-binding cassette domain-containing protein [Blastocatellia bacterium]
MMPQQSSVSVSHISKSYGDFQAVNDLSLEVAPGSIFGLLGPNGAGKSSTIRMIVNITMPDSGEVKLFGERMTDKHQERVGYLPEDRGLYKKMKVGEQLEFFAALKGMEAKTAKNRIDEWLERVSLTEWKNKKWEELSKGMQQKVQFVSTILHDPDLVILDEPFSGLDPINANLLKDVVQEMKARGKTIIFSTHLMEQAEQLCDSICLINRGQKVIDGKLREVKRAFLAKAKERRIALDAENFNGLLDGHPLVKTITPKSHHLEITLQDNADSQALLKDLVAADVRINRFELIEPTLNEIFIESVGAANAELLNN